MQILVKVPKSNIGQNDNAIIAQIITVEKINLITILKILQVVQVTSIILIRFYAYIYFETTAPTDECLDPENRKMFTVLYAIIYAFHPDLDIDRGIIECSFGHFREKLTSLNYLTRKQLNFEDNKRLLQLRDCACCH